jgi:hypothetical protein
VQHIKHVVAQFLRGLQDRDEVVITMTKETPKVGAVGAQAARSPVAWIVIGAIALLVAAAALLFIR